MASDREAVNAFLDDVEARLRALTTESPEAQLAGPLRTLFKDLAVLNGRDALDLLDQAAEPGIGRPDFSAKEGPLLVGHGANPFSMTPRR